jgi:hypothetical protein
VTRIKYRKVDDQLVFGPAMCGTQFIIATINTKHLTYEIRDQSEKLLAFGSHRTLAGIKREVKIALVKMGTNFLEEFRSSSKNKKYKV